MSHRAVRPFNFIPASRDNKTVSNIYEIGFATSFPIAPNSGMIMPVSPDNYFDENVPSACTFEFQKRYSSKWEFWRMLSWQGTLFMHETHSVKTNPIGVLVVSEFKGRELLMRPFSISDVCRHHNVKMLFEKKDQNVAHFSVQYGENDMPAYQIVDQGVPLDYCTGISLYNALGLDCSTHLRFFGKMTIQFLFEKYSPERPIISITPEELFYQVAEEIKRECQQAMAHQHNPSLMDTLD